MGVRPLDVEPEPRRLGAALLIAAIVLLVGVGIWLSTGPESVSAPTTSDRPAPTTTAEPSLTVMPPTAPLGDLIPGFRGRIRGVLANGDGGPQTWSWASGEIDPRLSPLPDNAIGTWDNDLDRVAAIADSSFGRSLFFGPIGNVREVHNAVESFAWHDSDANSLAWFSAAQADGKRELWRSSNVGSSFSASLVARLELAASLRAYGDWGFAFDIISPSEDRPRQMATYDAEGQLIASAPFAFFDASDGGDLLVASGAEGLDVQLGVVDVSLGGFTDVGPDSAVDGVFSPNGRWVAAVSLEQSGAELWLGTTDGSTQQTVPLGVDVASVIEWSSSGRWVLLQGSPDAPALTGSTQLIFVEAGSDRVFGVAVPGVITGLRIEATGQFGPDFFFAP